MKVEFWMLGKTSQAYIREAIKIYEKRVKYFFSFEIKEIKTQKAKSSHGIIKAEEEKILKLLKPGDYLILLDENGEQYTSAGFANRVEKLLTVSSSRLIFVVGGAYGFGNEVLQKANLRLSLSKMTFTHDICRIVFLEQFYRALTIINNHPYQH